MPTPQKSTLYIAGPMTGLPDLNFPAFHAEAYRLRAMGFEVVNPAEINPDKHLSWLECMRRDIAALVFCDGINLLPGWRWSKGATLEYFVAKRLGLIIILPPGELGWVIYPRWLWVALTAYRNWRAA